MGMGRRGALPLDPAKGVTRKRASHDALRTLHVEFEEGAHTDFATSALAPSSNSKCRIPKA